MIKRGNRSIRDTIIAITETPTEIPTETATHHKTIGHHIIHHTLTLSRRYKIRHVKTVISDRRYCNPDITVPISGVAMSFSN